MSCDSTSIVMNESPTGNSNECNITNPNLVVAAAAVTPALPAVAVDDLQLRLPEHIPAAEVVRRLDGLQLPQTRAPLLLELVHCSDFWVLGPVNQLPRMSLFGKQTPPYLL